MYGISKDCKISVLYRNLHTRSTSGVVLCNLHMVLHAGDHFPASVSRGFENLSDTKMGEIASCHPLSSRYLLLVSYSMSGLSLACHLPPAIKAPGNGQKKRGIIQKCRVPRLPPRQSDPNGSDSRSGGEEGEGGKEPPGGLVGSAERVWSGRRKLVLSLSLSCRSSTQPGCPFHRSNRLSLLEYVPHRFRDGNAHDLVGGAADMIQLNSRIHNHIQQITQDKAYCAPRGF